MEYSPASAILPLASQGILSIGKVYRDSTDQFSIIEVPRIYTPTGRGASFKYLLDNAMVHIHDSTSWDWSTGAPANGSFTNMNTSGVVIHEDITVGAEKLVLDFSSIGQIELGDGFSHLATPADPADPLTWGGTGGFNRILGNAVETSENKITIKIFAREKTTIPSSATDIYAGDVLLTLVITENGLTVEAFYGDGTSTGLQHPLSSVFGKYDLHQQSGDVEDFKCITLDLTGLSPIIDLATHTEIPSTLAANVYTTDYAFDFTISIDTVGTTPFAPAMATAYGSRTVYIDTDRLTF